MKARWVLAFVFLILCLTLVAGQTRLASSSGLGANPHDQVDVSREAPVSAEPGEEYAPRIARYGDRVYVAWYGDNRTSVAVSSDGGQNWDSPLSLEGVHPTVAVDMNGHVHLAYEYGGDIYYVESTDSGQTFTDPLLVSAGRAPDIAIDASGDPYIVGRDQTNIVLARLTTPGDTSAGLATTITTTMVSTTTVGWSEPPRVAVSPSGQNVYVIWKCPPVLGAYVRTWFTRSTDGGNTFELRFNPTGFTHHGEGSPDVAASGEDHVYIAWVLDQFAQVYTYFARSDRSGERGSFSPRVRLGQVEDNDDSTIIADALGRVCVAWRRVTEQESDLFYRCSPDGGRSFSTLRVLAAGPVGAAQYEPALALGSDGCTTYLDAVWEDTRNGNRDIFFTSMPVLGPVVEFSRPSYVVGEAEGSAVITVTLCTTSTETAHVRFSTSDGTALAGSDYLTASGVLTWTPGITSQSFPVPIFDDDLEETDETILLTLSEAGGSFVSGTNPVTLTILDNDTYLYLPLVLRGYPAP